MDTVIKDEKKLLDKISGLLKPGAVFLFHDTSENNPGRTCLHLLKKLNERVTKLYDWINCLTFEALCVKLCIRSYSY